MDLTDLKNSILGNYDFAFRIDWENSHHRKVHNYLASLTMYLGVRMNGHISTAGSYLAYRFNDRHQVPSDVEKFRKLFKNESPTFTEENCGGCCVFTF